MSQPTSDTASSPRPRSLAGYVGIFLVSTGVLWFLLWWNHDGIAVVSSLVRDVRQVAGLNRKGNFPGAARHHSDFPTSWLLGGGRSSDVSML
jgi:hypothetical protein